MNVLFWGEPDAHSREGGPSLVILLRRGELFWEKTFTRLNMAYMQLLIEIHAFYKQHFYKQHQAEIDKKNSKN